MRSTETDKRELVGSGDLVRVGRWSFPAYELTNGDDLVARLGQQSWWSIYFGRGQRIELIDGTRWRLRAVEMAGAMCPVVVNSDIRKVALAAPFHGVYGLNGPDWSYVFYPAQESGLARSNQWILREHEDDVAAFTRTPVTVEATAPVPLGAVFLAFALMRFAIPGETTLGVPTLRWGAF